MKYEIEVWNLNWEMWIMKYKILNVKYEVWSSIYVTWSIKYEGERWKLKFEMGNMAKCKLLNKKNEI